jgi:hypothetical protein
MLQRKLSCPIAAADLCNASTHVAEQKKEIFVEDFEEESAIEHVCKTPCLAQTWSPQARVRRQQAQMWRQLAKTNEEQARVVREQAETILQLRQDVRNGGVRPSCAAALVAQEYEMV